MQDTPQSYLRITTWPNVAVSVPPMMVESVRLVDGVWLDYSLPVREVELPDELYLRQARDVDLDDAEAIANFVAAYGRLGRPELRGRNMTWAFLPFPGGGALDLQAPVDLSLAILVRAADLNPAYSWDNRPFSHIAEVRLYLKYLRTFVEIWDKETRSPVHFDWENRTLESIGEFGDAAGKLGYLAEALSSGLKPFHPVVLSVFGRPASAVAYNTYSAMCLQLFNHVAENASYCTCASETCGRLFVRQLGRAKYDQHRTSGVRFCSKECARAQAQRDYRKRSASNRGERGGA
jgi:hypothetical protein